MATLSVSRTIAAFDAAYAFDAVDLALCLEALDCGDFALLRRHHEFAATLVRDVVCFEERVERAPAGHAEPRLQ